MTDQHDENKLIAERRAKLDELRTHEGPTFPNQFQPAHSAYELQMGFGEQSKEQLEALEIDGIRNFFTGKIHHLEVGRNCREEEAVMQRLSALVLRAEELVARNQFKEAKRKNAQREVSLLGELAAEYGKLCNEMMRLVDEPDRSTGHAFVVFHEELDRNKCYKHFNEATKGGKFGFVSVKDSLSSIACASDQGTPNVNASAAELRSLLWQGIEMVCLLPNRRETLQVRAAPEPDEVNWDALELDDLHEQKRVIFGRVLTLVIVAIGAGVLLFAKIIQFAYRVNPQPGMSSFMVLAIEQSGRTGIAAGVSLVTLSFNVMIRAVTRALVAAEGQDTRTDEQRSIFSKLSVALLMNTVIVPLLVGIFMSNGELADQTWYEPGGLLSSVALLCVFNYATDMAQVFNAVPLYSRFILSRFVYSRAMLKEYWKPVPFLMGSQYARCLVMMALGIVYGPIYPNAYLLTALGLAFKWLCTRFAMRNWYAFPMGVNQEMMMALRWRLGNCVGVSVIVQSLAIAQATGILDGSTSSLKDAGSKGLEGVGLVLFGAPIMVLVYAAFPLGIFKSFARYGQLEDADETDTAGVRFDDAAKKQGFPMPLYVCPTLPTLSELQAEAVMERPANAEHLSAGVAQAVEHLQRAYALLSPYGREPAQSMKYLMKSLNVGNTPPAAVEDAADQPAPASPLYEHGRVRPASHGVGARRVIQDIIAGQRLAAVAGEHGQRETSTKQPSATCGVEERL